MGRDTTAKWYLHAKFWTKLRVGGLKLKHGITVSNKTVRMFGSFGLCI